MFIPPPLYLLWKWGSYEFLNCFSLQVLIKVIFIAFDQPKDIASVMIIKKPMDFLILFSWEF